MSGVKLKKKFFFGNFLEVCPWETVSSSWWGAGEVCILLIYLNGKVCEAQESGLISL